MKTHSLFSNLIGITAGVLITSASNAKAGGTVNFGNNSSNRIVNAHTAAAVDATANVKAALYWSPLETNSFVQISSAVTVGVPVAGIFIGGTCTTGDATPGGASAKFQVRAWEGEYLTYEEAVLHPDVLVGQSAVFVNPTGNSGGAPPAPPESLLAGGFTGFAISSNVIVSQPPVLTGLGDKLVPCDSPWSFDPPIATDGCTGSNLTTAVIGTVTNGLCPMMVTRTWSVTNSCNTNFATSSQSVTVADIAPPLISGLSNKFVACDQAWDFDEPTAMDACSTNSIAILATITNDLCPLVVTRSWSATDACGNVSSFSQTVTVTPAAAPTLTGAKNKSVVCTNAWDFDAPIALDACGGGVPVEIVGTVTNSLCPLSLTRTWRATNDCNPVGVMCSQTVTVLCLDCQVLQLTKSCPAYPVPPSGTLVWTGTITNTSEVTLSNVVVTSEQPAPSTVVFGPVTLAPGEGASFAGSHTVPASSGPHTDTLTATGMGPEEIVFNESATASCAGTNLVTPGDMNGDGIVDQSELNAVLANYWSHSPWLYMTNATLLADGRFQFELTNAGAWNFTVQVSTNATDWINLPAPAFPVYQFADPDGTNAPQRLYRLRWP